MRIAPEFAVCLDDLAPEDSSFPHRSAERLLNFSRWHKENSIEARWSLVECGLQSRDWDKFLAWAARCPPSHVPSPKSFQAGILLLVVSAAVARNQENDVLWAPVAAQCSAPLRQAWFGRREYPVSECRESFRHACQMLRLRNQLHLRGKMHYWRTIMLQFGVNPRVAQRQLSTWLAGYVIPETIRTLLNPEDENSSESFQKFWAELNRIYRSSLSTDVSSIISASPWCPEESRSMLWAGLRQARTTKPTSSLERIEDEDRNPTVFGHPRLVGTDFILSISRNLPREVAAGAGRLTFAMQGIATGFLVTDAEGHLAFDGGSLRLAVRDVLRQPVREIKIILPSLGLYRERFSFWDEADDVALFAGNQGRRVVDVREVGMDVHRPFSLVARAYLQVRNAFEVLNCNDRSENWALYRFPEGLPQGLAVFAGEQLLWAVRTSAFTDRQSATHGRLLVTELSPSRLRVRIELEGGWTCGWFRFAGHKCLGSQGDIRVAPNFRFREAPAIVEVHNAHARAVLRLPAESSGPPASGAAYQSDDGRWNDLHGAFPLESGALEGRPLACRWHSGAEQEVWLMLGDLPIFAEPDLLRRQEISCCGESLYLRFGLMHEDHSRRIVLAFAMYATAMLAAVEIKEANFLLVLREPILRAGEFRVWVWERGKFSPRCLDPLEVELIGDATLCVLGESVAEPLGWLLSWEGVWRGSRFNVSPGTIGWNDLAKGWRDVIEQTGDWVATSKALRAWHFPVLMQPFCEDVRARATQEAFSTLDAWTSNEPLLTDHSGAFVAGSLVDYAAPIRELLPFLHVSEMATQDFFDQHAKAVLATDWQNSLYDPAAALLRGQPVLLAQLLIEGIKSEFDRREKQVKVVLVHGTFYKQRDPKAMAELRRSTELVVKVVLDRLHAYAGVPSRSARPDDLSFLQAAALNDLRSWVDSSPVDDKFFNSCITEQAERLLRGGEAELRWLRLATARSSVCCAFLAAHLVCRYLYSELRNGAL